MSELSNFRQVALKLHALHAEDREWLLGQLGSRQQSTLRQLIGELDEIGLIHTEHLPVPAEIYPVANFDLGQESVAMVDSASAEAVRKIFMPLPERLKAMILHCHSWQWAPDIWTALDTNERIRVLRHIGQFGGVKKAIFAALIDSLAEQILKWEAAPDTTLPFERRKA